MPNNLCLYIFYVWLACSRKSYTNGFNSTEVICNLQMKYKIKQIHLFLNEIFSLLSTLHKTEASATLFLSIVATYSLMPLLYKQELLAVKLSFFFTYILFLFVAFNFIFRTTFLRTHELIYICGFAFVFLYEHVIQYALGISERLPFMPLLLISLYCSMGITYFWFKYYAIFLFAENSSKIDKKSK